MNDRFDQLAPRDVAITLRSFRRRFGSISAAVRGPKLESLVDAPGPAGDSIAQIITQAAQTASLLANELERSLDHSAPVISLAVVDRSERVFVDDRSWPVAAATESLADDAERAADRLDEATASEQTRSVPVAGGDSTTPLGICQVFTRDSVEALGQAQRQLDWLRQQN